MRCFVLALVEAEEDLVAQMAVVALQPVEMVVPAIFISSGNKFLTELSKQVLCVC
jgi:hypothetical protein